MTTRKRAANVRHTPQRSVEHQLSDRQINPTTDSSAVDLSIAIVSYNTVDDLLACVDSILRETDQVTFEIIVVDNDSADESAEKVAAVDSRIIVVANNENRGFARAVNQALSLARGTFFLMLNPDSTICDRALEKCVTFLALQDGKTALTCNVTNSDGTPHRAILRGPEFTGLRAQLLMQLRLDRYCSGLSFMKKALIREFDFGSVSEISFAQGCFILIHSQFLRQLGGLDENFSLYGEDHDLCLRIYAEGGRILYFPDARVIHIGAESSKHIGLIAHEQQLNSRYLVYRKHFGGWRAFAFSAILGLGVIVDVVQYGRRYLTGRKTNPRSMRKARFTSLWCLGIRRPRPLPQRNQRTSPTDNTRI